MCKTCQKPYYKLRNAPSIPVDLTPLCSCYSDLCLGWICSNCGELWYNHDKQCDCGETIRGKDIIFVDSKVATLRSTLSNWWLSFKNKG